MSKIINEIENGQLRPNVQPFKVGDTIKVFSKIVEGDKERVQAFEGIVIKRQGGSIREMFTVRKLVQSVGVERTFFVHSPKIEKIQVVKAGHVRRAKLYYLRDRIGSAATRIKDSKNKEASK